MAARFDYHKAIVKQKPKPKRWRQWLWALIKFVGLPVLSAFLVFQIFAFIRSPDAGVEVHEYTQNYCVAYSVQIMHARTIDGAHFSIRFPSRLNSGKMGITEDIGTSKEQWMHALYGDLDMNSCFLGTGGNPVDASGITSNITGNTLSVHSGTVLGHVPVQGFVVGPTHQSTSEPAPKAPVFEGEYSYNVFGISVERSLTYVNSGSTEMK